MSAARNLVVGDIVQWFGRGRGMTVLNTGAPWEGIENAVLCQSIVDGEERVEGFPADQLEVVGGKPRQSHAEVYTWLTKATMSTVSSLVCAGKLEAARGAFQLWSDAVGPAGRDDDTLLLLNLIERARIA